MKESFLYQVIPGGMLRELCFRYDIIELLANGQVIEIRHNRRFCDFQNAKNSIIRGGAVIISKE